MTKRRELLRSGVPRLAMHVRKSSESKKRNLAGHLKTGADIVRNLAAIGIILSALTWVREIDDRRSEREAAGLQARHRMAMALRESSEGANPLTTIGITRWFLEREQTLANLSVRTGNVMSEFSSAEHTSLVGISVSNGFAFVAINDAIADITAFSLSAQDGQIVLASRAKTSLVGSRIGQGGFVALRGWDLSVVHSEVENGVIALSPYESGIAIETEEEWQRRTQYSSCRWRHCLRETTGSLNQVRMTGGRLVLQTDITEMDGVELSGTLVQMREGTRMTVGVRGFCYDDSTQFVYRTLGWATPSTGDPVDSIPPSDEDCDITREGVRLPDLPPASVIEPS